MDLRIQCLCIDTAEPAKLADFWQAALGWRRTHAEDDEIVLEPPAGSPGDGIVPDLLFLRVPDEKVAKNRLHLDLRPRDQATEVARLTELGARRIDIGQGPDVSWVVMADPEATSSACYGPSPRSGGYPQAAMRSGGANQPAARVAVDGDSRRGDGVDGGSGTGSRGWSDRGLAADR